MPTPDFVLELRRSVGQAELWLPGVTAVVRREDEVLLVRRADNGAWTPVTGILEPGEEAAVGAAREVLEETGVHVRVDRLASTGVMRRVVHVNGDVASYLDLTFACTWLDGEAHPADDESADVQWRRLDALPAMREVFLERIAAATSGEQLARFQS
jgi:ADP-ribose pyrophosphatase YjhB (NUDIX family)